MKINLSKIKIFLEKKFHIKFVVKSIADTTFVVSLYDSNNDSFALQVNIKDDIRLTITAEPEKYAKQFVELINKSSQEKRSLFCNYWGLLNEKFLSLKINGVPINKLDFETNNSIWDTFMLRYSISPYYEEGQNSELCICESISNIIAMMLSLIDYRIEGYEEGNEQTVRHKKYERNPINRQMCLLAFGYKCQVCGFDFRKKYGEIGANFIEVHHKIPVSKMGAGYIVDPIKDLIPVCSNCHSMLHKKDPPYSPEELIQIINEVNNDSDRN